MTARVTFLEDLPAGKRPKRQAKFDWQTAADMLRKRPWEWAILREDAPRSTITALRKGKYAAFRPPMDFRFTTVATNDRRRVILYGMFVAAPRPEDYEGRPKP